MLFGDYTGGLNEGRAAAALECGVVCKERLAVHFELDQQFMNILATVVRRLNDVPRNSMLMRSLQLARFWKQTGCAVRLVLGREYRASVYRGSSSISSSSGSVSGGTSIAETFGNYTYAEDVYEADDEETRTGGDLGYDGHGDGHGYTSDSSLNAIFL
ncbi:hypothetical protein NX059_009331 [Plenodomus lindquistii]|nr:hypothetical protein NX059_009331 [Plenodomus lindquistii]